jgi:uncharacterized pyridoxamine 5'-phosphate oxidase family protein
MSFEEWVRFANENPLNRIATIDGDKPRVRLFAMWFADKTGFYFQSGTMRDTYTQSKANPNMEACF